MKKEQLLRYYKTEPVILQNASKCWDSMLNALYEVDLLSPLMMLAMISTVRIEVGRDFLPKKEIITEAQANANYQNHKWLGNKLPGDGYRFIGRGWPQLTGRYNYEDMSKKLGIDLVNNPDLLLDPEVSAKVMVQFAKDKGIKPLAEAQNWTAVRFKWNGGSNGLSEFQKKITEFSKPL